MTIPGPIKAPDQGDRRTIAIKQARLRGVDPCLPGQGQGEHFALGDRPLVANAWKLAYRKVAVIIHNGALRTKAAKGCAAPA
jgi:hypothetical protein